MAPSKYKRRPKYAPPEMPVVDTTAAEPEEMRTVTILEPMFRALCLNSIRYDHLRGQHSDPAGMDVEVDRQIAAKMANDLTNAHEVM